ncbi:MAG: chromate resistance protein, partial [Acidobacteria bacterium]
ETTPESAGLWAISQGFTEVAGDDPEIVERASFLYDSLYAHLRQRIGDPSRRK